MNALTLAERGLLPDILIRYGIRRLLAARLAQERRRPEDYLPHLLEELRTGPVALATAAANEQHYEVPTAFYEQILGPRLKYSATSWPEGCDDLGESEEHSLRLVAERAQLADGQEVLELGCGWGSFSLWAAERYPRSRLLAVSNSATQRAHIEEQVRVRGLGNLEVRTADMNGFAPGRVFDRVVSIEMFEHMRNYQELLRRISTWLRPEGRLFVHIFTHHRHAYPFEDDGRSDDWMARYFFTGGMMPSDALLLHFPSHLQVEGHWTINGRHYQRTLEAWLRRLDERRAVILPILARTYGSGQAALWCQRWRIFLMACSELFGYDGGREWIVSHYRFAPAGATGPVSVAE